MQQSETRREPIRVSEEILAAGVCFVLAGLFQSRTGISGRPLEWVYPQWLLIFIAAVGVILLVRGLLGYGEKYELVPPILRGEGRDVAVFILIAVIYVLLLEPVGFWPTSILMVFVASMILTTERTVRTAAVAAVTAVAIAVIGHLVFRRIFYIPFPEPPWWPL